MKSDDKKRARLNCIRYFLLQLDYPGKDLKAIGELDRQIINVPTTQFRDSNFDIIAD